MVQKRDFYEILGVGRNATQDELKQAYRKLAKKHHPDVNKDPDAEERFKEINEAYAILSDEKHRASYDRYGYAGVEGIPIDFDFSQFSDIFGGDFFSQFFGFGGMGQRRGRRSPRRGANLRYDLSLEFKQAAFGIEKEIEYSRLEACSQCNGSGAKPGTTPTQCPTCHGAGEVRQTRQTFLGSMVNVTTCPTCRGRGEVINTPCQNCKGSGFVRKTIRRKISVPAGIDDGTQIRIAGEGEIGTNSGPRGDLYIVAHVKKHRFFNRRDQDILLDLSINVAQAALGAEVTVPTLDGEDKLRIPPGTQSGKVIRLRGKGVPRLQRNGRGDELVIISVEIPRSLNSEQRKLFMELAETMGNEAKPQERGFLDGIREFLGGRAI